MRFFIKNSRKSGRYISRQEIFYYLRCLVIPLLCMVVLTTTAKGQTIEVTGNVVDMYDEKPIPNAHVVLIRSEDSSIVAFATTAANGVFYLKKEVGPPQDYYLKITCLGYARKILTQLNPGLNTLNISLEPENLNLPEVSISAERTIRQNGDTISFQTDFYNKMAEQNIEDLLKTMPHFKVDEAGNIYFRNQKINKVFIEGDNLSGNRYQVLTRSLNPAVIDKIQVIENFSENRILANLGGDKETIINLTVKEDRKKLLFGNAHIRAGQQYDGVVSLLSVHRKSKQLLVASSNNAGFERNIRSNDNDNMMQRGSAAEVARAPSLHNRVHSPIRRLNANVENINNEQTVRYALATPITSQLKLNFDINAAKDINSNLFQTRSTFFTEDNFSIFQADTLQIKPAEATARLDVDYTLRPKTIIRFKSELAGREDALQKNSLFAISDFDYTTFWQTYATRNRLTFNTIEITNKINDYQAIQMDWSQSWSSNRDYYQTNNLVTDLWSFVMNNAAPLPNTFSQLLDNKRSTIEGKLMWYYAKNKINLQSGVNALRTNSQYNVSLGNDEALRLDNLNERITFTQTGSYRIKNFEARLSLDLALVQQAISDQKYTRQLLLPSISTVYKLPTSNNVVQTIVASLSKNYDQNIDVALIDTPLFTDFRSVQIGYNNDLLINENTTGSLSYIYFDLFRHLTFNINLFASKNNSWDFNNYTLQPDFSRSELINLKNLGNWGAQIDLEKSLYFIKGNVKLEVLTTANRFRNIVNQTERDIYGWLTSSNIQYRSFFNFPVNVELSYYLRYNQYRFFTDNNLFSENAFYDTRLKTSILFKHEHFLARIHSNRTDIAGNTIWIFGGRLDYQLNKALKFSLDFFNGMNKRNYTILNINPMSQVESAYLLLGRFAMLGLQLGF